MLVPTWFQLGHNLVPKKSFQEGSKSQPKLHLGLDALSDRFLIDLGCHFQGFCDVGQISYKRQLDPQNCHLGSNLVPTWVNVGRVFGFQVGAKLALNGIKTPRNKQSKKGLLLEGLKIDVCRFLGTTWGVQGGSTNQVLELFLSLGALLRPRWLQEQPTRPGPKTPSKTDLLSNFG